MSNYKRYLITAALPYANGPVHIGHLAGVYVPADIYARYLRLKGRDVLYICGSDEHGVPITLKAKREGKSPQEIVDKYHYSIKESFEKFGMSFDIYSRTSSKVHYDTASGFFRKLYDTNQLIEKEEEQYFDKEANQFLADRYIQGTCPHCGHEEAYGDQCENCGTSLSPTELINPKSMLSGSELEMRKTRHWFLPLDKHEPFLRKWILEENTHWKSNIYGQCKSWLDQGLQPRAVSRDLDWGVPLPVEGTEGKVLYVWFDAPIGYISATKELTNDWEKYWKDNESKLVHFIGKDNIVFHCIIFPTMLKNHGEYILPANVPGNEFLNLENDKISTSKNWAVWLHEYLDEFQGKEDVLRYVLTANMPETKDNNFTWKDFQDRNNNELVAIYGNFVNRALVLTNKYFNGEVPEPNTFTEFDTETFNEISNLKKELETNIENYHFRQALKAMMDIARLGNKYLADTEPWNLIKHDEERVKTVIYSSLQIAAALSVLSEPFLPFTADKLRQFLNINAFNWDKTGDEKEFLQPGHTINKSSLLFEKIEDEVVEKQRNKLLENKRKAEQTNSEAPAQKENISFEDFQKLDIRVARILEAEKVPKTKKLLKLTVDTGLDKRTVVSGIAEVYSPEELVDKQVSLVVNLEPRKIRGIESQGMILMAENTEGTLVFLGPDQEIDNGSVVK